MTNTKIWAISVIGIVCVWFFTVTASSLRPVFIAIALAYFVYPFVLWIQDKLRVKRKSLAVGICLAAIVAVLIILINIMLPALTTQVTRFAREFSGYSMRFIQLMDIIGEYMDTLGLDYRVTGQIDEFLRQIVSMVGNSLMGAVTAAIAYISSVTDFVIILVLLFYFLQDGPDMVAFLIQHTPQSLRESSENIIEGISSVVWGYLKNQVLISTIHGICCYIAFLLIRLPYSGLLGVMNGVLNMIPFFGSIVASAITILVALFYHGVKESILTALAVLVLNMVLGNIIAPRLQAKTLGIHPVLVIAALLAFNHIWGALGMFVAVPLLGVLQLVMKEVIILIRKL